MTRVVEPDPVPLGGHGGEEFQVHLVADADPGRHDAQPLEGLRPPLEEGVALAVARELELEVLPEGVGASPRRRPAPSGRPPRSTGTSGSTFAAALPARAMAARIAARSTMSGTPVKSWASTRETTKGISSVRCGPGLPGAERPDVLLVDAHAVEVPDQRLEHHPDRDGEPRDLPEALLLQRGQGMVAAGPSAADGEVGEDAQRVGHRRSLRRPVLTRGLAHARQGSVPTHPEEPRPEEEEDGLGEREARHHRTVDGRAPSRASRAPGRPGRSPPRSGRRRGGSRRGAPARATPAPRSPAPASPAAAGARRRAPATSGSAPASSGPIRGEAPGGGGSVRQGAARARPQAPCAWKRASGSPVTRQRSPAWRARPGDRQGGRGERREPPLASLDRDPGERNGHQDAAGTGEREEHPEPARQPRSPLRRGPEARHRERAGRAPPDRPTRGRSRRGREARRARSASPTPRRRGPGRAARGATARGAGPRSRPGAPRRTRTPRPRRARAGGAARTVQG